MDRPPRPPAEAPAQGDEEHIVVPVLAEGADPGRTLPSALAIRDRMSVPRRLLEDHPSDRLFAYEVTRPQLEFLKGVADVGDKIVFRRGGRVSPDRICAVRREGRIVLARAEFHGDSIVLLPGDGVDGMEPVRIPITKGLRGVVAGTHILLIRR